MASVPAPAQILCRQCSAPLPIEQGTQYVDCDYCGTTNIVDKSEKVFHYAVRETVRENEAVAALRRWMAGNATIKDLDKKARIEKIVFQHFPMWFVRANRNGQEEIYLEPAAALSISELKQLTIPASDLEPYDHGLDEMAVEATVPYNAMLSWLKEEHGLTKPEIREVSLVHLPTYVMKYQYKDRSFTAVVDAATSRVFANIYPAKWETPYLAIGAAAFAAYFCAALVPLGGYLSNSGEGAVLGILIYAVVAVILAIPFFIVALTISAKV